jgi:putative PIN family toxin of toxin-antitoxin system
VVPRVVFDTNVFVSAYGFRGSPADLIRAAIRGEIRLVTSPPILAEVARVLADKLEFEQERVEAVVRQIARVADVVVADEPDNRILECAVAGEADFIISGDRHLLSLGEYAGIQVLGVAEALGKLRLVT